MIDPLLSGVRKKIDDLIDSRKTVIDIGCGTGELVFRLAKKSINVLGIDTNTEMIKYAREKGKRLKIQNIEFKKIDAVDIDQIISKKSFDYAIFSMFFHQLNSGEANRILKTVLRIMKFIIIADYNNPLPENIAGQGVRLIERMAGGEHYLNFKQYQEYSGLNYFFNLYNLLVLESDIGGLDTIKIVKVST